MLKCYKDDMFNFIKEYGFKPEDFEPVEAEVKKDVLSFTLSYKKERRLYCKVTDVGGEYDTMYSNPPYTPGTYDKFKFEYSTYSPEFEVDDFIRMLPVDMKDLLRHLQDFLDNIKRYERENDDVPSLWNQ